MVIEFVIHFLWHDADPGSKVAKRSLKSLCPNRASDCRTPWIFLLLREGVEYSCTTLFCELHYLGGWQGPFVAKDILEILGICRYLYHIKKWYVDI